MSLVEEYTHLVENHLERLNSLFKQELDDLSNKAFPEEVRFFHFEYESQCFHNDFSVYMFAMNNQGKAINNIHLFLQGKAVVVPKDIYMNEKYDDIDHGSTTFAILESWLIARWNESVKNVYPAYLAHHDSYFFRNMKDGTTINWDEIIETHKNG